ncbi:MAG: hypothetical protein SPF70_00750, partial [Lachnospiraceae bacterium]|nr:hypothetical protein [Lachnospiraceae bacterium]
MNIRMIHKKKFIISICAIVMIAIAIPFISSYLTAKKTKAEEEIGTKIALAVTYLEQEGYIEETGNYTVYGTEKHYQTKENGNIPVSVEELVAEAPSDKTYAINEEKDLLALMILSTQTDLEGYTFSVDQKTGVTSTTSYSVKNEAYGFVGISPIAEHPFKG